MLTVLLSAALAAQPKVAVHVATALKVSPARQDETVAFIARALHGAGLEVVAAETACAGDEPCLLEHARKNGLDAIVVVTLGPAGSALAVDLDALRARDAAHPAQATFRFDPKAPARSEPAVLELGAKLAAALPVADAPVAAGPTLTPAAPPSEPVISAASPGRPSRAGPLVAGGFALGAVAVAAGFGFAGLSQQRFAEATDDGLHALAKEADVRAAVSRANTYYSVSLAAASVAGALLIAAVVWGLSL